MTENERKTPEEIKQKILEALDDKPLNAQDISKAISSNWSTVKNYVEGLAKEGKVKEISFKGQAVYLKITEDTYFNIPIKEKHREMFRFIFYNAINKYQEKTGKQIRKTELAKLSAELNSDLKLNLPIVWYLYGPMPLMIIDLKKDYNTDFKPENAEEIKTAISKWINENKRNLIRELRVEYYQKSKNTVYYLKEKIFQSLEKKDYSMIDDLFFDFLCSVISYNKKFEEIASEVYLIISGAGYMHLTDSPEFQNRFLLAFDSLWKYISIEMMIDSLKKLDYPVEEIWLLLGLLSDNKEHLAKENIAELREFYEEHLPEKIDAPKFTEVGEEARKIMSEWLDSGVWRD